MIISKSNCTKERFCAKIRAFKAETVVKVLNQEFDAKKYRGRPCSCLLLPKIFKTTKVMKKIEERIEELETMVYQSKNVLTFNEASKFIGISKSYLYKLTSAGLIPHYKPSGKMIYFEKSALERWMRQNPVSTVALVDDMANNYLMSNPLK
jgi:excisionase family DNA binding protein